MNRYVTTVLSALGTLLLAATLQAQSVTNHTSQADLGRVRQKLARMSPTFIENRGQWPRAVRFYSRTNGLDTWVTDQGIVYDIYSQNTGNAGTTTMATAAAPHADAAASRRTGHILRMEFAGASGTAATRGVERVPGYYNFFLGKDATRWATNVPQYRETMLENIYDGIDARLYYDGGRPRYDLIVSPKADPASIRIRYAGADRMRVNDRGELVITTSMGEIAQQGLYAYQVVGGRQSAVPCAFKLGADGTVGFALGRHEASVPVVIDPLLYSTYLGGSGDDNAYAMAVDASGFAYLTGYASSWAALTDSFPVRSGAYDRTFNGGTIDAFVTKLDCRNDTLSYSTFVGGSSYEDARGIVLDASNNAYVCGYTGSADFPTTPGAYAAAYNGGPFDAFVFKLSPSGSNLAYSTFIGGGYTDGAYAIALGPNGTARVCGYTGSADFPTTAGAYDRTFHGNDDIFVLTLSNTGGSLLSSTYVGGSGTDYAYAILADAAGNVYVSGNTSSNDFPTTANAYDRTYNGGAHDACVLRITAGDNSLSYSTYLGGGGDDYAYGIDIGASGRLTLCGYTSSSDFPTTAGAYSRAYNGGAFDIFITKFEPSFQTLNYSTFFGGASDDYAYDVVLDAAENAFVCGNTASDSVTFRTTKGAYQRVHNGISYDGYVMEMNTAGNALTYCTYLGGSEADIAYDIDLSGGAIYVCGTTHSRNFPITATAFDDTLGKAYVDGRDVFAYDAFVSKLDLRNISLTQPTGAGTICTNGAYNIAWESYLVDNVSIQISSDGGATFPTTVVSSTPAAAGQITSSLLATLPPGTHYRVRIADAANPTVADTSDFDLTVPPTLGITTQPATTMACLNDSASLSVTATGLGLRYNWRKNGVTIAGGNVPVFRFKSVSAADTATYTVDVVDTCGNLVTSAPVKLLVAPDLVATGNLGAMTLCPGDTLRLVANALGHGRVRYQWRFKGTDIAGATDSTYNLKIQGSNQSGAYDVVVTDDCPNHQKTLTATVTVNPVTIVTQPVDRTVNLGTQVVFTTAIASGQAVTYQWRHNGVNIPNATDSFYVIPNATAADTGLYDVVITGACGTISNAARLTINGVGAVPGDALTGEGMLLTVMPNPSTGRTLITLNPPLDAVRGTGAELALYNVLGQKVLDLSHGFIAGGYRSADFDAASIPAGLYYCRLSSGSWSGISRTVIVVR